MELHFVYTGPFFGPVPFSTARVLVLKLNCLIQMFVAQPPEHVKFHKEMNIIERRCLSASIITTKCTCETEEAYATPRISCLSFLDERSVGRFGVHPDGQKLTVSFVEFLS